MPRIYVISRATTIKKSHCRAAVMIVITKMLMRTSASPLRIQNGKVNMFQIVDVGHLL